MEENMWTRRGLISGALAVTGTVVLGSNAEGVASVAPAPTAKTGGRARTVVYVGSWTSREREARGPGLSVYHVDQDNGLWRLHQVLAADDGNADTPHKPGHLPESPSFLCLDRDRRFLYATHADTSKISAFSADPRSGALTFLNTVDCGGTNPVRITVDPSNRWVVLANYDAPGSVVTFPLRADGSLGQLVHRVLLPGEPGPHVDDQQGSYPHSVQFDPSGRWLLVSDRGLDRIFVLQLDARTGKLTLHEPGTARLREVSGPRHLVFHPRLPVAYSVEELRSCVTAWDWDHQRGQLSPAQVWPTTPPDMTGDNRSAEITVTPSGRFVYVSNRSGAWVTDPHQRRDTIGCWEVDQRDGRLTPSGWTSTGGLQVRHFSLNRDGDRLFAANQHSDLIVSYAVEARTGKLRELGERVVTGTPTCIALSEPL